MLTSLINEMGVPGLICTVAVVVFLGYCIVKGGSKGSGGGSNNSSSTTPPPPPSTGA